MKLGGYSDANLFPITPHKLSLAVSASNIWHSKERRFTFFFFLDKTKEKTKAKFQKERQNEYV